jgi:hypothetical protein
VAEEKATKQPRSLPSPRELDPRVDFSDGAVDQADGAFAMTALVGKSFPELLPGGTKMTARIDHVRLRGVGTAGHDAGDECQTEEQGTKNRSMFHHILLNFSS